MPDVPLSPQRDNAELDPQLISALQRYDERLSERATAESSVVETVENLPAAAERIVDCLHLLERVWPRTERSTEDASGAPVQLGRFLLRRVIGQGGFGTVYLAHDPQLGRGVAVKVPRLHALAHPGLRERFYREARAAAGLDHPHIVPVYEAGDADGVCYIVSAYCPGPSLAAWLKEHGGRGIPPRRAAQLVIDLADAVAYSHSKGVLHRDIKPGNVLLIPSDDDRRDSTAEAAGSSKMAAGATFVPRLSDFGLAKLIDDAAGELKAEETAASVTLGTPAYMAPEQVSGDDRRNAPTVDVYALGAVLYELLAGRPPFLGAKVIDVLEQVRAVEPAPLRLLRRDVPRDLETICLKCLQKSPERRYGTAAELRDDLRRFVRGEPIVARPPGAVELVTKWVRRKPAAAAVLLTVVLSAIGGFALQARHSGSLQQANDELATTNQRLKESLDEARRLSEEAQARANKLHTRSYMASLGVAQRDLFEGNGQHAREILAESIPAISTDVDEREFEWAYLWAQASGPTAQREFSHGGAPLTAAAISPDGKLGVTADEQGGLKVWSLSAGTELASHKAHQARVAALEFSDDGRYLASGGSFDKVCIWRTDDWQLERAFVAHAGTIETIDFSDNGDQLVTGGRDAAIRIWDWRRSVLTSETLVTAEAGEDVIVCRARFAPDRRSVVAMSTKGRVLCWDPSSGNTSLIVQTPEREKLIGSDVSGDGGLIAAAGYFGGLTFTTSTGSRVIRAPVGDAAYNCALSQNGRRALFGCGSGAVRLVDVGQNLKSLNVRRWFGHSAKVAGVAMTRDGAFALTASADGTAKLWDLATVPDVGEALLYSHDADVVSHQNPVPSPDGRWLATRVERESGKAILLQDLRGEYEERWLGAGAFWIDRLQFSQDSRMVFTVRAPDDNNSRRLVAWNVETLREEQVGPPFYVNTFCLPGDDRHAVIVHHWGEDRAISMWDLKERRRGFDMATAYPSHVHEIRVMSDRSFVAVCSEGANPFVMDVRTGWRCILSQSDPQAYSAVPHPLEWRLAVIREGGLAEWFDVTPPQGFDTPVESAFPIMPAPTPGIESIAFSPDGRLAAISVGAEIQEESQKNRVVLMDVASNHRLFSLPTFGLAPNGIHWMPDRMAVVGALKRSLPSDPCIILWRLGDPAASSTTEAEHERR